MRKTVQRLVVYSLLIAFAVFIIWAFFQAYSFFEDVDANVQASIIAGFFALIVTLFNWDYQRRKAEFERHKEIKVKFYEELITFYHNFQKKVRKEGLENIDEYLQSDEFFDFSWDTGKDLVLWGSPGVIRAYYEMFKPTREQTDDTPIERLSRMEKLYLEIRKDLGLSNFGLKKFDLIGMMVNDIEDHRHS